MIFYGILDLFAKPFFCFYHVFILSKADYNKLGFTSVFEYPARREKQG